ncbi:MAG: hypothetical protein IPN29_11650 [Saprospiraceae bacterium]|nr:hypothetical protein [Saprospiraceae bacterium]
MHINKLIPLLCLLFFNNLQGQGVLDLDQWKSYKFRNIGPAGMSGRITAIDVDLSDDKRIFLGSASGGLWLSENGGISFKPVFDEAGALAIGSVKINQRNPSEIWVGTGEGNPRNSLNTGDGIYKSIDGGSTWKNMGLTQTKTIHRIIIHRDNADVVFAAALGSPWGPNEDRGVFKTTDGGKTWKKVLYVNSLTGAADLVVDPSNPNKMIAAMWEHHREPWFFTSGGEGSGLYITYDAGETWKKLKPEDGLPKGDLGRTGLAFAPSSPNIVYALIEAKENGLYKSEDGGRKWKLIQSKDIGNRPFYYAEIYVDPKNENRLYNVFTYLTRSDDGGKSFYNIADYGNAVHPDHHALWVHPDNPYFLIDGNDGGAAISRDMGNSWTFIANLPVGQFYHINVDNDFPYNVYGGMQDNGSWAGPSSALKPGGIRNSDFQELYFGDGFDVVPELHNSRYGYAMSQGGNLGYYDRETGFTKFIKPVHPEGKKLRFNWNAAIARDPFQRCGVYYGSQYLHHSLDCGDNWTILSPDLTTNDSTKQKQHLTGGLTLDATGAENHTTIISIAPSPLDDQIIWVGTDDGNVQLTTDGGKTWANLSRKIKGLPEGAWIPQIEVSALDTGEAWVVANDYRRNDYGAYAWHTTDFGKSWTRVVDNDQIKGFVLCIVQDKEVPNLVFLGSDAGLYVSFDLGQHWQHWDKGFPKVQVSDMKIQESERDLAIATFGRSLWILDDITPLRAIAKNAEVLKSGLHLFDPPAARACKFRSYDGVRFFAQGDFTGDNDNMSQAVLQLWTPPMDKNKVESKGGESKKEKAVKSKDSKAKVFILNASGDTLRRFSVKIEGGYQKFNWSMDQDGIRGPSRRDLEKDADPPGGVPVLPGSYKVVITYKGSKDSATIEVKPDPRLEFTAEEYQRKQASIVEFSKVQKRGAEAFEQLKDFRKQMKSVDALKVLQPDSIGEKIDKLHKPLKSKIDSLEAIIILPEDTKGIAYDDDKLSTYLSRTSNYLGTSSSGFTSNSRAMANMANTQLDALISGIRKFLDEDWKKYESTLVGMKLKLFQETRKLE